MKERESIPCLSVFDSAQQERWTFSFSQY